MTRHHARCHDATWEAALSGSLKDLFNPFRVNLNVLNLTPKSWTNLSISLQSTYCSNMLRHCENIGRAAHVVNLDPAAEYFDYEPLAGKDKD